MADKSTIYRVELSLSDIDRGIYQELSLRLARHPSETDERLVARLLAYALNYDETLEFSKGICDGDSPDIWRHDQNDRISDWIEVGLPAPERIIEACRRAQQVRFYLYGRRLSQWQQMHQQKLQGLTNLELFEIPARFLDALVASVDRSLEWSLTVTEGVIYLSANGQSLETSLPPVPLQT